jgi:hypothetical protein
VYITNDEIYSYKCQKDEDETDESGDGDDNRKLSLKRSGKREQSSG